MGNAEGLQRRSQVPRHRRFSVQLLGHNAGEHGDILYEFLVEPPAGLKSPGQSVERSFKEFSKLDAVVAQRHRGLAPRLPRKEMLFARRDATFITARAAGLATYLEALLMLEPLPRTLALRRFLGIFQPLEPLPNGTMYGEGGSGLGGPVVMCNGLRLSVGLVATVLAFLEVKLLFNACGGVCRGMLGAVRQPQCWPTLRFCSGRCERWLDALFTLLHPISGCLQALALDTGFENPRLAIALPGGLIFGMLQCLSLRFSDHETANLAAELLECVDSPSLRTLAFEGIVMTTELLSAACRVACAASGGLTGLALSWLPSEHRQIQVDEGAALAIGRLLDASPLLEELKVGIPLEFKGKGVGRSLAALYPPDAAIPNTQPLLAGTAYLASLQQLTFDFLSNDALTCMQDLADRSLCVRSAKISGVSQLFMSELDDALVLLLAKLGDGLEEFELTTELPELLQPYTRGFLRNRVGALPESWHGRESLRSLVVNCTAFDDNGVHCIADNCPRLHTLLLDRCEYWTDAVATIIARQLPELRRFRLRKSSMLSDQALYTLGEVAERFTCLEIEISFSMSHFATEQLRARLSGGAEEPNSWDLLLPSARPSLVAEAFDQHGQGAMLRILGPPDDEVQHNGTWRELTRHRKLSIGRW